MIIWYQQAILCTAMQIQILNIIFLYLKVGPDIQVIIICLNIVGNIVRPDVADVVAIKLGIILSSFSFFPSTYFSPRRGLPRKLKFGG